MAAESLISLLQGAPEFASLLDGIKRGFPDQMVYGVSASLKTFIMAALHTQAGRPCLVVTSSMQQAERIREDLTTWLPDADVVAFPPMEYMPFEVVAHSPEVVGQRLYVLERLARGETPIVVAPAAALYRSLTPRSVFAGALLTLKPGLAIGRDGLVARLVRQGYERV
ncbi:MAG TPA: transcription-repair coupling factor, partial [Symbiobacteriaceae bacterium]|nr:transcription-repair coupling factor [Symbiobacteriaceae bacterium]